MRLSRRALCRGGVAAGLTLAARGLLGARVAGSSVALAQGPSVAPPAATPAAAAGPDTVALLRELILQRALSSKDPWIQAHVVLALGAGVASGGKPVLDSLVEETLRTEAVDFKQYPYFPAEVERHPFHFLQIMQVTGVAYTRAFVTPVGRFDRREILAGSEALLVPEEIHDELSWLVSVLTHEFPPDRDAFATARGLEIRVSEIVQRHLTETEAAYAETFAAMAGTANYKRGEIHRTACNGTHMLYGLIDALRFGYTGSNLRPRTTRLVGALFFRMRAEPALIDASLRAGHAMIRLNADAAKLTFLGHALEDLGYAVQHGVFQLTDAQREIVDRAREQLAQIVARLTSEHDLDALEREIPQAYKLVLGDACHALRGLRYWS